MVKVMGNKGMIDYLEREKTRLNNRITKIENILRVILEEIKRPELKTLLRGY